MASRIPQYAWSNVPVRDSATNAGSSPASDSRELMLTGGRPQSQDVAAVPTRTQSGREVVVVRPDGYEPNYAYPLIVWLHGTGGNAGEVNALLPAISERNYFGLSFESETEGQAWDMSCEGVWDFARELHDTVCRVRSCHHIHSERIFVAGFTSGASLALQLMLQWPDWFGGAILLGDARLPANAPFARLKQLRSKRVFLGAGRYDHCVNVKRFANTARQLHCAGLDVTAGVFDCEHEISAEMLRNVDHWLIDRINRSAAV